MIHALRLESGPFLTRFSVSVCKFLLQCQAWLWINTARMHHLVFHKLPKIVGLQADSKLPQAHINNGVHINSKDKAGMQQNRTRHIFIHQYDCIRFSILSSISSIQCPKLPSSTGLATCQQSVQFVAVLDAVLPSVAMIPSLSVALADAIQAPLAPKLFLCIRGEI